MAGLDRYRWVELDQTREPDVFELSPVMAEAIAYTAAGGQPTILIRRQPPYLLLGPQDRRLPQLERAVNEVQAGGWPTFMRIGGGSAVLLDDRCLSFAVARPCRDFTTLERNFRELAGGVIRALHDLGLPAKFGQAAGSYCEGPYDIVVHGQKVAGVSQAIRRGFALVSGMVLLDQDPVATTAHIQRFYQSAGSDKVLQASAVTNLSRLLDRPILHAELTTALRGGFAAQFSLVVDRLTAQERATAQTLYPLRRFPPLVRAAGA